MSRGPIPLWTLLLYCIIAVKPYLKNIDYSELVEIQKTLVSPGTTFCTLTVFRQLVEALFCICIEITHFMAN